MGEDLTFQKLATAVFSLAVLLVYFGVIYLIMALAVTNFGLLVLGLIGTGGSLVFLNYLLRRIVRIVLV